MLPSHVRGALPAVLLALLLGLLGLAACGPASRFNAGQPATTGAPATSAAKPPPAKPAANKPATPATATQVKQTVVTAAGPAGSVLKTGNRSVALTFDDGPDPVNTPKILDLLKKYGVKATFCLIGSNVRANPALVRRIVAEGHTICNHTWHHYTDLAKRTDAVIRKEINDTTAAILAAAPTAKISYFRAPGGNYTPHLVALARSLGLTSLYWAVDPRDWDFPTYGHGASMVKHVVAAVEHYVRPGAIILSHDFRKPDTITAYGTLLPWLKARYTLIPMPV